MPAPRKPKPGQSLAETKPELAEEWHPTKNGIFTAFDFYKGTNKKVWWKCDKGPDHEWQASIKSRTGGNKCPVCSGRKVVKSNSIETTHPEITKEWHTTKNFDKKPINYSKGSHTKVWWKCDKGPDHEWQAPIYSRTEGQGCPICSGRKAVASNCLENLNPELSKQWHPTKNGLLTPKMVTIYSSKNVWWKCEHAPDHIWKANISDRSDGNGCPGCSGRMVVASNCLENLNPELSKQWHPTKNGKLTPSNVTTGYSKKVWWKCNSGVDHEWRATVAKRTAGRNCPVCASQKVVKSVCLETTHPLIALSWHSIKNGSLKPDEFLANSNKKVWWKCDKGPDHEWHARIADRVNGGCPGCSGRMVVASNCLENLNPELSKQWHPTKNGKLTPSKITSNSSKKVWWKCNLGIDHEWKTSVLNRNVTHCPYCSLTPQSREELTITFELIKIFKDINPKGHKLKIKGKLRSIDIFLPHLSIGIEFDGSYWHKGEKRKR